MDMHRIRERIGELSGELLRRQSGDGAWRMCFDSGTMTDSHYIILLRALGRSDETLIRALAARIASKQLASGAWQLYPDEKEGSLDATAEACYALLCAGYNREWEPRIQLAKQFIRSQGGLSQVRSLLTQVILAATGQAEWPLLLRIPLEAFFSNNGLGLDLFSLSGHARVHLIPTLIMANRQYARRSAYLPDLTDLFLGGSRTFANDSTWISALNGFLSTLPLSSLLTSGSPTAEEQAVTFMLDRVEPNGTLLTYSTATMLMTLALLAAGYPEHSPVIEHLLRGIRSLLCLDKPHIQIASSEIWDTAMLGYALREAGVQGTSPAMERAGAYLLPKQQTRLGDWAIRKPDTQPGGWGFSEANTIYPDVDDSVAALRAVRPYIDRVTGGDADWQRGLNWVLAMRNDDGGWPAFERKGASLPASFFAFEGASDIATDPSTVDLTGRMLAFLGQELDMSLGQQWIDDSVQWVLSQQTRDGSWYGRWGIAYIHGTGAAIQGLKAVGIASDHPALTKAVKWLLAIQNEDGGWGESCLSDKLKRYVPLGASTPSQTAWALDALIAVHDKPTAELGKGADALLAALDRRDWTYTYPTGAGLPGSVYVHYASNNYIWPLLTLSSLVKKYGGPQA
ncbi:prenyltransferase/squalene oxidase repeat-containing protein [Paenibacillus arenilitoris]|uniref:Squalene cyclase n=1 Tax=Paenibacillus arenilitoris TaxID=2772299 RepID=A0A927CLP9_9BACL|nr:prenyltransferase/squalene oxidase repeat-containing protein [Paenibacillus arenilitoris]MBD2869517.1 squalene cyclase [Paenibacillus arenilitoris]